MGIPFLLLLAPLAVQLGGESRTLLQLEGPSQAPLLGSDLAAYGDHDGDGIDDHLVGATGAVHVVSGANSSVLLKITHAAASFGTVVTAIADVDSDGFGEILVGAPMDTPGGISESGAAFLYSGIDGQLLFSWQGGTPYGGFGAASSPLPDMNGDGTPDLAIGAPRAGAQDRGKVFLYSGLDGGLLYTLTGTAYDDFGAALALADDLDFDGIPDLIVGAPGHEDPGVSWGALFLYSGADGHLIRKVVGPCASCSSFSYSFGANLTLLEDMDGDGIQEIALALPDASWAGWVSQGLMRVYSGATGIPLLEIGGFHDLHRFGSAVGSLGDVDLDGKGDLAVLASNSTEGYLYSGTGALLGTFTLGPVGMTRIIGTDDLDGDGFTDLLVSSPPSSVVAAVSAASGTEIHRMARTASYGFGSALAAVGDVDGDGQADVAIGDPSGGTFSDQGVVTVFAGDDGSILLNLEGAASHAGFGNAILGLGDVDGDGKADFLVGAPGSLGGIGEVSAHSGADGSLLYSHAGAPGSRFGQSLALLSDWDGDGQRDYLVGAPQADAVMVHSGADGSFLWQVNGANSGDSFGSSVAAADFNQDGLLDLIVGAPLSKPWHPSWRSGSVHVHSGLDGSLLFEKRGPRNEDANLGFAVANAGDLDGDGVDDLVAGAPSEFTGFSWGGVVYAWSGATSLQLQRHEGTGFEMFLGNAVASAGDVDRDGHADLLLGSDAQGYSLISGATGKLLHRDASGTLEHRLGRAVAPLGDLDDDGHPEFGVGAPHQAGHGVAGTAFVYGFSPFLSTDNYALSVSQGGHLNLELDFPDHAAQHDYRVLVSTSGVGPGFYGVSIPLTADATARASFQGIYPFPVYAGLQGTLDNTGNATASITLPSGMHPGLVGFRFWLAAVALDATQVPEASSVALPFRIGP